MPHEEKLEKILKAIEDGYELIISNYGRAWKINKKIVDKFEKLNRPVLIAKKDGIYMSSGKNYLCTLGCTFRLFK